MSRLSRSQEQVVAIPKRNLRAFSVQMKKPRDGTSQRYQLFTDLQKASFIRHLQLLGSITGFVSSCLTQSRNSSSGRSSTTSP